MNQDIVKVIITVPRNSPLGDDLNRDKEQNLSRLEKLSSTEHTSSGQQTDLQIQAVHV
jgi:hypothetical protein